MFRTLRLVAAVLVSAAITAPLASANQKPVDPLAVSMLRGQGFSASQIWDLTHDACSYQVKPDICYLTPAAKRLAAKRQADFMSRAYQAYQPADVVNRTVSVGSGFDWGDGLIGSGVTAAILIVAAAGAFALHRRRDLAHT